MFLVEDVESDDVKCATPDNVLPSNPIELPIAKVPIKFSEICSRSSNQ